MHDERATAQVLWSACRPEPDDAAVIAAIDAGADVTRAALMAMVGRAGPLLWRALQRADRLDHLGDLEPTLRFDHALRRSQAAVLLPLAVATAVGPLTGGGLEPLVYKGPVVAGRYPEPGLRPMDDLDVILPASQHEQGLTRLADGGWRPVNRAGNHHDTVLRHPSVPDLALELHRGFGAWRDRTQRLTADDLWRARVEVDCFGSRAYSVAPELELVALAVHAGKPFHTFQRLIWSVDFAVVVQAAGDRFDWDLLARHAEHYRCRTVVAIALRHARRLGAEVPDELIALRLGRHRMAALRPVLDERWPLTPADAGEHHRLRYAPWDDRWRWALLFGGDVTRSGFRQAPAELVAQVRMGLRRLWHSRGDRNSEVS